MHLGKTLLVSWNMGLKALSFHQYKNGGSFERNFHSASNHGSFSLMLFHKGIFYIFSSSSDENLGQQTKPHDKEPHLLKGYLKNVLVVLTNIHNNINYLFIFYTTLM
jgi:hypothetical protein